MNKKHMRRGQAAMEFLMTYGWAILVVLAAIGALAYFGVLSPDNFLPERCTISPEFGCLEHQARSSDNAVSLGIQNNVGQSLAEVNISLVDPADGTTEWCRGVTGPAAGITNGQRVNGSLIVLDCTSPTPGTTLTADERLNANIVISYQESGSQLVHTRSGTLQTVVQ